MPEVFHLRSHIRSVIIDLLRHKEKLKSQDEFAVATIQDRTDGGGGGE
jgi:hypothetical protein